MKTQPIIATIAPWQNILLVDVDAGTADAVRHAGGMRIRTAATLEQATLEMQRDPAGLVLVNVHTQDHGGYELIESFNRRWPHSLVLAVARRRQVDICLQAFRAGAADVVFEPINSESLRSAVTRADTQRNTRHRLVWRNQRLRTVCRQLNKARHEISQQVDLLCNDLVKAYQELASQFNEAQSAGELEKALGDDLEIERLLRRTLELVLKKLGPMNAAVFLPDSEGNYSLGAYLNFDTNPDSIFVSMVAQTIVTRAAERHATVSFPADDALSKAFGDDARLLLGRTWLATPAIKENDCVAVLVAFHPQHKPLPQNTQHLFETLAALLAQRISNSINVYNRMKFTDEDSGE